MGLKAALEKLDDAIEDLTSLHVQTFTGSLNVTINGNEGYTDLRTAVEAQKNDVNGGLVLVSETLAQFDGDSYNFVKQDLASVPQVALEVHKNAVKAGIETRLGLLGLFKDIFK